MAAPEHWEGAQGITRLLPQQCPFRASCQGFATRASCQGDATREYPAVVVPPQSILTSDATTEYSAKVMPSQSILKLMTASQGGQRLLQCPQGFARVGQHQTGSGMVVWLCTGRHGGA